MISSSRALSGASGSDDAWGRIRRVVESGSEDGLSSPYWGFSSITEIPLGHPENIRLVFTLYNELLEVAEDNPGVRLLLVEMDDIFGRVGLTDKERHVFTLVFIEGLEYDEVARRLRIVLWRVEEHVESALGQIAREAVRNRIRK